MSKKIYIAFYDDEEGGSRENWNTFYTPWVASLVSQEDAKRLAQEAIQRDIVDSIKHQFNIDITTVDDESTLSEEVQEELDWLRSSAAGKIIEIQEGTLGD